ncbi:VMA21-like domain-containing protein [Carex littledalei]|uniref:VMA21-like domain-containing protein n=1 Tax=Carex littledalei TaxID=544730 RepID=A0A833RIS5_9POAL|nr:VMA21-like domain-containing protein [Carex littledalei]
MLPVPVPTSSSVSQVELMNLSQTQERERVESTRILAHPMFVQLLFGPGASQLSAEKKTLIGGFIAVISVNLVIGFYICMAMKESPTRQSQQQYCPVPHGYWYTL